jgi:hypothetical protein
LTVYPTYHPWNTKKYLEHFLQIYFLGKKIYIMQVSWKSQSLPMVSTLADLVEEYNKIFFHFITSKPSILVAPTTV